MCPKQRRITAEALLPFLLPLGILTWEDADVVPPWETGLLTGMEQKGPSGARRVCWGFSCRSIRLSATHLLPSPWEPVFTQHFFKNGFTLLSFICE